MVRSRIRRSAWVLSTAATLALAGTATADINGLNPADFQLNGGAAFNGTQLVLTTGSESEARTAFHNTTQNISNFTATFTYRFLGEGTDPFNLPPADGLAFIVQNNDPTAVGGAGGALAYEGISNSAAVGIDIFGGLSGQTFLRLGLGGSLGQSTALTPLKLGADGPNPTNPVQFTIQSNGRIVTTTARDTVTGTTREVRFAANVPGAVGSGSAFVGFGGATGGATATQSVSDFTFITGNAPAQPAPTGAAQPIALTGWNGDAILEAGGAMPNPLSDRGYVVQGATASNPNNGLPNTPSRRITSKATNPLATGNTVFEFQPYDGNNVLRVNPDSTTNTLTLATPGKYDSVAILAANDAGDGIGTVQFNYADGTSSLARYFSPDWYIGDGAPADRLARDAFTTSPGWILANGTDYNSIFSMFESNLPTDPTKTLVSMTFLDHPGDAGGATGIFAISGVLVPEPGSLSLLGLSALLLARRNRRPA